MIIQRNLFCLVSQTQHSPKFRALEFALSHKLATCVIGDKHGDVRESRYTDTKQKLAVRCGISYRRLLSNWGRPSRPKDHSAGSTKYDVLAYREWIRSWRSAHNFGSRNGEFVYTPNERERALIEKNKIATAREKFRLEVEMAAYIPRQQACQQIESANAIVRRELHKALVMELPARLEMLKAAEIRKVTQAKYDEIVSHLPGLILKPLSGTSSNES